MAWVFLQDSFSEPPKGKPAFWGKGGKALTDEGASLARTTNLQSSSDEVEVVAALIRDKGRFLICQRPPHKARGLLWEFVGGKVEPGETRT